MTTMSKFTNYLPSLIALVVMAASTVVSGNEQMDLCGFERPELVGKIWPVFMHDPGEPAEMEIPHVDVLINRKGDPIGIMPVNEIPEVEMKSLRKIIPAMQFKSGNACEEPIEGYAKCAFYDYFVLQEPEWEEGNVIPPQPRWRVSKEFNARLAAYSLTYEEKLAIVDFHLDAEGNLKKLKGRTKYGSALASKLFRPDKKNLTFIPAKLDGQPVESVIRLHIGNKKNAGKETVILPRSDEPYHVVRSWPEALPLEELFTVDAELLLTDDGIVTDVMLLSQMPSELSTQLMTDMRVWRIDPSHIPEKEGPKSMMVKLAFDPADGSPNLLKVGIKITNSVPPKPIKRRAPAYPRDLRRAGVSGVVVVKFVVKSDGSVGNQEILISTNPGFAKASMEAISKWQFEPAKHNGRPVSVWVRQAIPFSFTRHDS